MGILWVNCAVYCSVVACYRVGWIMKRLKWNCMNSSSFQLYKKATAVVVDLYIYVYVFICVCFLGCRYIERYAWLILNERFD